MGEYRHEVPARMPPGRGELCLGQPQHRQSSQGREVPRASPLLLSPCQSFYNYFYEFPQGNKKIKA